MLLWFVHWLCNLYKLRLIHDEPKTCAVTCLLHYPGIYEESRRTTNAVSGMMSTKINKKSSAIANGNAQRLRCMFESPVKQSLSQSPEGARRPAVIVLYSYPPEGVTYLAQPTPYRLDIANYHLFLASSFGGDPLRINRKALRFLKLESSRQPRWRFGDPSLHRFWLIHPCDGQTDRRTDRRTESDG